MRCDPDAPKSRTRTGTKGARAKVKPAEGKCRHTTGDRARKSRNPLKRAPSQTSSQCQTSGVTSFPSSDVVAEALLANGAERELDRMARQYAFEALSTLADIARAGESDSARVAAIKELLNRGLGRSNLRRGQGVEAINKVPVLKIVPYVDGTRD